MLHVTFHIATLDGQYREWLQARLPAELEDAMCFHDHNVYRLKNGDELQWSRHKILAQLKKPAPSDTVPLLWDLCRHYDCADETSDAVRQYCAELGLQLEAVPFYRESDALVVTCQGTTLKKVDGIDTQQQNNDTLTVYVRPTEKLQRFLWDRLYRIVTPGEQP